MEGFQVRLDLPQATFEGLGDPTFKEAVMTIRSKCNESLKVETSYSSDAYRLRSEMAERDLAAAEEEEEEEEDVADEARIAEEASLQASESGDVLMVAPIRPDEGNVQ